MKEAIKNNKKVIIIGIVIIVLLLIGVAFAYLTTTLHGEKEYLVRAGSLGLRLEEGNELTLEKQIPLEDSEGMSLDGFNFSLINEGGIDTDFTIYLDDIALDEGENRMPDSAIRYSLTKNEKAGSADDLSNMGVNPNRVVDSGSIAVDETITYTLRIWIDYDATTEEASGKTFKGKLRVEASQHVIPETTKKILADNELQKEKENMFNYASNGSYTSYFDPVDGPEESNDSNYITKGLYSMEDEDGTSYYFRGNVDNNNVQFGEYANDYYVYRYTNTNGYATWDFATLEDCQTFALEDRGSCGESNKVLKYSAGTPMYWKIVRVNGDGSLRLIYNGTNIDATDEDRTIGTGYYNTDYDNPKYTGYTYDRNTNETDSNAKKIIDRWYQTALKGSSYDSMISSGRFCSDSSGYKSSSEYGMDVEYMYSSSENLFASHDRLYQAITNYKKPNAPTLKCPSTSESYGGSYRLKAGLITADELILSGVIPDVISDSYLNTGGYASYWTMTPGGFGYQKARLWERNPGYLSLSSYSSANKASYFNPVINVTTENGFASGDGTVENIYVIS